MKFFFLKTDSLYKIFKTLEKIPPQKPVEMFIDPEHSFFENLRRGQKLQEIVKARNLNITFQAEKQQNRAYFQQLWLQVHFKQERLIVKLLKTFSLFLFDIKKFHLHTYNKQKYLLYMVIFFEALAGLGILWWLALFILPSANITLKVAQQRENIIYNFRYYPHADWEYLGAIKQLSIPYYTGAIEYRYSLAISTENIHHIINPSAWTVKIYNKTPNELNLLANTRFVTKDGLTFLTKEPITIPAGSEKTASELKVKLYAAEYDEHQQIIGTRGNIPNNTKLTIKNIKDSFYLNLIRAEAIENFTWGSSTSLGMISENDRELLAKKIKDAVYRDKLNIVSREFKEKNTMVLLADSLIKTRFNDISIEGKIGDRATTLKGNAQVSFDFFYLKRSDVVKAFSLYVHERQSDSIQLISIDPTSFALIMQDFKRAVQDKVFVVPTKVAILQGYDFTRDIKGILAMIKNAIVWKTIEESRKIILTYPEIASTKIDVWVFGGDSLPNIKSRLNLQVEF